MHHGPRQFILSQAFLKEIEIKKPEKSHFLKKEKYQSDNNKA